MDVSVKLQELQSGAVARGRKWLDGSNEDEVRSLAALLALFAVACGSLSACACHLGLVSFARGDALKVIVRKLLQKMWLEELLRVAEYSLQKSVQRLCKDAKGVSWLEDALKDEVVVLTRWAARNNLQWLEHAVNGLSQTNLAAVCKAFGTYQQQGQPKPSVKEMQDGLVQGVWRVLCCDIPIPEPGHWYVAEEPREDARQTILQLDFPRDETLLTFCKLAGEEKFRLTACGMDTVYTCKRVACKLNVSIQNLQILLPNDKLLASYRRANPTATIDWALVRMVLLPVAVYSLDWTRRHLAVGLPNGEVRVWDSQVRCGALDEDRLWELALTKLDQK
eukprot:s1837_g2.t1